MSKVDGKKEHFRTALKDWATRFYEFEFGKLNLKQRSDAFLRFYLEEIHNRLYAPISKDDIEMGIVDASGDLGVDFIHRDDNNVIIIQAKCLREGAKIELDDIINFQSLLDRLYKGEVQRNSRLAEALSDIDFEHDSFSMKFLSLATIIGEARAQAETAPSLPLSDMSERTEFQFFDECDLTEELRNAKLFSTGIPGRCEIVAAGKRTQRSSVIELEAPPFRSAVFVVDAMQLVQLYEQHKDSLFTLNIRNYLGSTSTNRLLLETLKNNPEKFYYFNNGVSCLAETLEVHPDRVYATKLQVINGAQTLRSLHKINHSRKYKGNLKSALVGVRITEAKTQYGSEGRFRNDIVRFNNTQNVIKVSDFKSNDPIHADLKKQFGQHRRNGKPVVYVSKRSDLRDYKSSYIVPMEEFAKVTYSFLRDPISFSARTSFLFDDAENGGYTWVFGDGKQLYTTMPDSEFKLREAIWWLAEAYTELIKSDRQSTTDPIEKAALERKWFVLFIAHLVLQRSYEGQDFLEPFTATYKGEWKLGEGAVGKWLQTLYDVSKESLLYLYRSASSRQNFIHRNWMRNKATVDEIATYLKSAPIRLAKRA